MESEKEKTDKEDNPTSISGSIEDNTHATSNYSSTHAAKSINTLLCEKFEGSNDLERILISMLQLEKNAPSSLTSDSKEGSVGQPNSITRNNNIIFESHKDHTYEEEKTQIIINAVNKDSSRTLIKDKSQLESSMTILTASKELDHNHHNLAESLKELLTSGKIDCAICYCNIQPDASLWSCGRCYGPFHLKCIKQWVENNPINKEEGKKQDGLLQFYKWTCPKCNYCYVEEMPVYTCFCGKTPNPKRDSHSIPHSCRNICGKSRGVSCAHPCNLQCHPGPCPPCDLFDKTTNCYCGKMVVQIKCSESNLGFGCGSTCDNLLLCGEHKCKLECHKGPCPPCDKVHFKACYCEKLVQAQYGGIEHYSCGKKCGKALNCGNHKCLQICHEGPCKACPYTPDILKACACKNQVPLSALGAGNRKSCLDSIPSCGLPCEKELECGHICKAMCHIGDCPECEEIIVQSCRCENSWRNIKCHKARLGSAVDRVFTCEKICTKTKACGNHKCHSVCCNATKYDDPEGRHLCVKICEKPLACKNHKCDLFCHLGGCPPCQVIINQPLTCYCGAAVTYPPIKCGSLRPYCSKRCSKPRPCGHACPMKCHVDACPPCHELVEKLCNCGRNSIKNVKCCMEVSCGKPCDKIFDCGHECGVVCHKGECDVIKGKVGCGKRCGQPRGCGHPCAADCHPGNPCPEDIKCKFEVRRACLCGHRKAVIQCGEAKEKPIECDESCLKAQRYITLLTKASNQKVYYPANLVSAAKADVGFLLKVEAFIENFLKEGKSSASLPLQDRNPSRISLLKALFSRHYYLNYQLHLKYSQPLVIIMPSNDTIVPSVKLSEYLKKIEKKEIDPNVLPFEATLRFLNTTKFDRCDELVTLLLIKTS